MRGSALLRWRTGDVVEAIETTPCPGCGRMVARVTGTRRGALVVGSAAGRTVNGRTVDGRTVDLRALAGALTGRSDVQDWRVVVGARARDAREQVVVHLVPAGEDAGEAAVGAAADIRAVAGMLPTQLVVANADDLGGLQGTPLTRRMLLRS
jgi:hypothetical protein